jgi:hypothetical protein
MEVENHLSLTPHKEGSIKIRVIVQPDDVQVKRVGRASCIEPEIKVAVESDSPYPTPITINAYLKVLGRDNKYKMILLRKSDEITLSKAHRREVIGMKLRFLKTIKVQVLKRNLGVSRPEASVVFEAVNRQNEVEGSTSTTHFAIISDPRYLEEVKKRRALERDDDENVEDGDELYEPRRRGPKRRHVSKNFADSESDNHLRLANGNLSADHVSPLRLNEAGYFRPPLLIHSNNASPVPDASPNNNNDNPPYLYTDSDEEEYRLIKLVEGLKHSYRPSQLCEYPILPSASA